MLHGSTHPGSTRPNQQAFPHGGGPANPWSGLNVSGFGGGPACLPPQGGGQRGGRWAPRGRRGHEGHVPHGRHNNAHDVFGGGGGVNVCHGSVVHSRRGHNRGPRGGPPGRLLYPPAPSYPPYYGGSMAPFHPHYPHSLGYGYDTGFHPPCAPGIPLSISLNSAPSTYPGFSPQVSHVPGFGSGHSSFSPPYFPPPQGAYVPPGMFYSGQPQPYYVPPPSGPLPVNPGYYPQANHGYGPQVGLVRAPPMRTLGDQAPNQCRRQGTYPFPLPAADPTSGPWLHASPTPPVRSVTISAPGRPLRRISSTAPQHFVPSSAMSGIENAQARGDAGEGSGCDNNGQGGSIFRPISYRGAGGR
jgi:hypothetical protein